MYRRRSISLFWCVHEFHWHLFAALLLPSHRSSNINNSANPKLFRHFLHFLCSSKYVERLLYTISVQSFSFSVSLHFHFENGWESKRNSVKKKEKLSIYAPRTQGSYRICAYQISIRRQELHKTAKRVADTFMPKRDFFLFKNLAP